MGRLIAPLGAGPHGLFDSANAIEVELFGGALASLPDIDMFAGGNAAAVMTAGGDWEVLQFAEAELVGTKQLPADAASARAMRNRAGDGDRAPSRRGLCSARCARSRRCRCAPTSSGCRFAIASARRVTTTPRRAFVELTITAEGVGLHSLRAGVLQGASATSPPATSRSRGSAAPASAAWHGNLSRCRSTRRREAYRVEILDGAAVVRTVETSAPAYHLRRCERSGRRFRRSRRVSLHAPRGAAQRDGRGRALQTPGNRLNA